MPVEIDKILTNTRTFLLLLAMGGSGLYFIFNNWNKFELLQVQQEQVLMRLDNLEKLERLESLDKAIAALSKELEDFERINCLHKNAILKLFYKNHPPVKGAEEKYLGDGCGSGVFEILGSTPTPVKKEGGE